MGKELFRHTIGIQDEIINDLREDNERLLEGNEVLRGHNQRLRWDSKRLLGLLSRCGPHLLILEGAMESTEKDFWKLIKEIEREVGDESNRK